jgi:iron complex outermembrane receptor protein
MKPVLFSAWFSPVHLACLCLLLSAAAAAQTSDEEELALAYGNQASISIATGNSQSLRTAPAVATVITAQDIRAMGATDLDQVLETVPGLHVSTNSVRYPPIYIVRGIYTQNNPQVLMLQNGVPMTTLFDGNRGGAWGGYPVEHIARIEIIRGPGSALYGADAYAGVINIITKSAADSKGIHVGAHTGSFGMRDAWLEYGGNLGDVEVALYLRTGVTDGFKRIIDADAQTGLDAVFNTHASLAPGPVNTGAKATDANLEFLRGNWRLRVSAKLRSDVGIGVGAADALDPTGRESSNRTHADLTWSDAQLARDWGAGFSASMLRYDEVTDPAYVVYPAGARIGPSFFPNGMLGAPSTYERQTRLSGFVTFSGLAQHRMRLGAGYDNLDIYKTTEFKNFSFAPSGLPIPLEQLVDFSNTAPFLAPMRRTVEYVYAQDEWSLAKDWTVTAGVRHDRYSDVGSTTNPRLALVWNASLDVTAKFLYGQAFRAPSFNEVGGINNPVLKGNPLLRPETMKTLEAALAWQANAKTRVNMNLYQYAMRDIIKAIPDPAIPTVSIFSNAGNQDGHGMEFEFVYDPNSNWHVTGNYAHQRSTVGNADAGYAPQNHALARVDWRFAPNWMLGSQLNWVANRARAQGDTRSAIADYTSLDLALRTTAVKNWEFSAGLRNALNADIREPSVAPGTALPGDVPQAGQAFYLRAVLKL